MRRFLALGVIAVILAGSINLSTVSSARADTLWVGNYELKTYRNNWGNYPTGPLTYAYCGGGAWGGTYNATISVQKRTSLWRDAYEQTFWGWWDWVYKGYSHGYAGGYSGAETNVYHGRCTRAASDHYYWNGSAWIFLEDTSDGF